MSLNETRQLHSLSTNVCLRRVFRAARLLCCTVLALPVDADASYEDLAQAFAWTTS